MRFIAIIILAPIMAMAFPFIAIGHYFSEAWDWWVSVAERFHQFLERK